MTRDELIAKLSFRCAEQIASRHNLNENIMGLIRKAYVLGTIWADAHPKNVWHSIDDIPKGQYDIICKGKKVKCWHCDWKYIYENYPNWKEFVETMNVEKWLYIHEL